MEMGGAQRGKKKSRPAEGTREKEGEETEKKRGQRGRGARKE